MIRVAIVEDDDKEAQLLIECLTKYEKDIGEGFNVLRFCNADTFLESCVAGRGGGFDLVFMDIELPTINGISAAFKLRQFDSQVVLIFVTNMAQFAVKGYEVDALDYIIKPVKYQKLQFKLQKAIEIIKANTEVELTIAQANGYVRLSSKDICYIEVRGHKLSYHTPKDVIEGRGTLSDIAQNLKSKHFMRCNSCYLVNPRYIICVRGLNVIMRNGDELKISQPKRKEFMNSLTDWLG